MNGIHRFKRTIQFIVSIIISREFAFVYCVLGTIAQVAHTYFLTSSISSLDGSWKILQAVILSVFISSSLLYFVAIADKEGKRKYDDSEEKIEQAIIVFTIIEILINTYYYTRHILLDAWNAGLEPNYFDFGFACIIGVLIPWTIKMYSSHIKAKEWLLNFDVKNNTKLIDENNNQINIDNINQLISDKVDEILPNDIDLKEKINRMVADVFKNNQDKFVQQMENKIKFMVNNNQRNNEQTNIN